jgi:hypothetical protein
MQSCRRQNFHPELLLVQQAMPWGKVVRLTEAVPTPPGASLHCLWRYHDRFCPKRLSPGGLAAGLVFQALRHFSCGITQRLH